MTIPFHPDISEKQRESLRISLNRVTMADILENVHVKETIQTKGERCRLVKMRFEWLPKKVYKDKFCVAHNEIMDYFEKKFVHKVGKKSIKFLYPKRKNCDKFSLFTFDYRDCRF